MEPMFIRRVQHEVDIANHVGECLHAQLQHPRVIEHQYSNPLNPVHHHALLKHATPHQPG